MQDRLQRKMAMAFGYQWSWARWAFILLACCAAFSLTSWLTSHLGFHLSQLLSFHLPLANRPKKKPFRHAVLTPRPQMDAGRYPDSDICCHWQIFARIFTTHKHSSSGLLGCNPVTGQAGHIHGNSVPLILVSGVRGLSCSLGQDLTRSPKPSVRRANKA